MYGLIPFNRRRDIARSRDVWDLRSLLGDVFSDSFLVPGFTGSGAIRADIRETDKEYIIEADLPGAKKEEIKIDFDDDTLTIKVERNEETSEEKENYIRKERRYGSLSRSFYVDNVNHESVTAKYDAGVLTINLPKSTEEKQKKHTIEIS